MKTLSLLALLLLFAALPTAAELKPGTRCDTAFLEKVVTDLKAGATVRDPRVIDKAVGTMIFPALAFNDLKICDAGTWRHLATGTPLVWRNADAAKYWNDGNAGPNAALVLVADDFFKSYDPKVAEALAAADEVIAAGVAIGVAVTADPPKEHLDFLKANSGGALAVSTPKAISLTVPDDKKGGTVTPESVVKTWQKLLDERGATRSGGEAVMRFRLAVLELGAEIGRQSRVNTTARLGASVNLIGVRDFIPGVPAGFAAAAFDKSAAAQDAKYDVAVAALTGKGALLLNDAAPRADALLDRVDIGLRNLVSLRAAQVDAIVAAAKARLNGKTITAIGVAARASSTAATAKDPLAQAAMRALAATPEYMKLDALYENMKAKGSTPETDAALRAIDLERRDMQAAALSATVEADPKGRKSVVFTQGGRKAVLGSFVPPVEGKEGDADRASVAEIIADLIVDRTKAKASYQTLMAAIGGAGEPGQVLPTGVTPEEKPVSREVPPELKPIKDVGTGSIADLFRNDHERYAARQRAAAAEQATENQRARALITEQNARNLAAADVECKRDLAAAGATKGTDFDSKERIEGIRESARAVAVERCAVAKNKLADDLAGALAGRDEADRKSNADSINAEADRVLTASFRKAIEVSVATLRHEYVTVDAPRQGRLIRDAKLSGTSATLVGFVNLWFNSTWPPEPETPAKLKPAVTTCATALGLGDKDQSPSYRNPENPDKVAEHCKVHSDLTKFVVGKKGTVQ